MRNVSYNIFMKKLILIKFGGSLITDKSKINVARHDVIENLAKQLKSVESVESVKSGETSFIIATGAGGFGHPVAKKYEHDLKEGQPFIKEAVKKINNIIITSLNKKDVKAESVEPSKISEYSDGKLISLSHGLIVSLLENNIIPVFHADLINDQKLGISILSMDRFLVDVAINLKNKGYNIEKVIFCGTTNGVLDNQGKTIKKISKTDITEFDNIFYDNKIIDTSGGMRSKVKECLRLAKEKIPCVIMNGLLLSESRQFNIKSATTIWHNNS